MAGDGRFEGSLWDYLPSWKWKQSDLNLKFMKSVAFVQ